MRSVDDIQKSIRMFGYAHLMTLEHSREEAEKLADQAGCKIVNTASYTYTLRPKEAVLETDKEKEEKWEKIRKEQEEARIKRAVARKKKAQNK